MLYPELANSASVTILADLKSAGIVITPATTAYLTAIDAHTRCWKGVFAATGAWLAQASAQEQAVAWQSIIKICDQDERPLAAMSRLYYFRTNAAGLKTLWLALPVGSLPILRTALASNPLLYAMFADPSSGVTGLPSNLATPAEAAAMWVKVQHKMNKLSQFDKPVSA